MDDEPTTSSPKPKRRALARRWFRDIKNDLRIKLKPPLHISHSHAGLPSRPQSRRSSHSTTRSSVSPKPTPWEGLKATLNELHRNAELVPPLKSAIGGLASLLGLFEAAAKNRRDYEQLASDLEITAEFLNQHLKAPTGGQQMERISSIARTIEKEIASIKTQQERSTTARVLGAGGDEEDLIGRYRRIEQLLYRIQIEASMGTWIIANEHLADTRLEKLAPAKLASYDSKLSTSINRRTCTENTRKEILSNLNSWSDNPDGEKVYWMDGMAGTGKTTIACTLASELKSRRQLAASFFCTRTSPECRDADRIVPTIAYQLARQSTPFRSALSQVLGEDPDLGSRNISTQFQRLLKDPLEVVKGQIANNLVVIIDALDECDNGRVVAQILEVLFRFVSNLPIKLFITSRPEAAIREKMFSLENTSRSILHLHDIEQSLVQEDIELYLQEELLFMSPSTTDMKRLAILANNLFIYAATAVRYIRPGKARVDHHERLATMLAVDSKSQKKFAQIDILYAIILRAALHDDEIEPKERERMELVLWTAVCAQEPIPIETLAALVGLNENHTRMALEPFRSVLHVSEHTGLVSTLHASFPDYIFSRDRSGEFSCDVSLHSQLLVRKCMEVMKGQLRFNICDLSSSLLYDNEVPDLKARIEQNISPKLSYACRYWPEHLRAAGALDELREIVNEFLSQRLLFWMEVLNLKGDMAIGTQGLVKAQTWLRTTDGFSDSVKLASDAHKFVARFAAHAISMSTPHIYTSALPLCPPSSLISVHYRQRMGGLIEVKGTAIVRLGQAALASWTTNSPIHSSAYSPDGSTAASGSHDGTICIRNVHDGKIIVGPFKGHSDIVTSIAFSPDGTRIVSGSWDKTVRMWDARDGTPVAGPFKGHTDFVQSVAFSPDGARIVSGSRNSTIQVWDACDGTLIADPFEGHTEQVNSVAYSPDGKRIVSGSNDCSVRTWDAKTGALLNVFVGHTDLVRSVQFSPDGMRIVSGSHDQTIRVWNADDGTLAIHPLGGHTGPIKPVAYSPDGALIVSGSFDQTIRVWSPHEGTLVAGPFEGHADIINSVEFSPDGAHIQSSSSDGSICIWNVFDSPLSSVSPKGHTLAIHSAEFSPDGALIASSSDDWTIWVWSAVGGTVVAGPLEGHSDGVLSVAFSPDSTHIASGSFDCTIRVWHARDGVLIAGPFEGHSGSVWSVAFSPDGTRIVSGSDDCTIRVWNVFDGTLVADPFKGHTDHIFSVMFSPDGAYIASGSQDGTIRIWNSSDGSQITDPFQGHTKPISSIRFSHDGSRIVSGSEDRTIHIWNARDGKIIAGPFEGHTDDVTSVAFSPDSTLVISGSDDSTIRFWSSLDGTSVAPPLLGHADRVRAVRFSPDGSSILSCSNDQTLRVWIAEQAQRTSGALVEPWTVRDDGWVLNADSQLLCWVPPEIAKYFPRLNNRFTIGPLGSVQVDFAPAVLGEEWDKVWLDA